MPLLKGTVIKLTSRFKPDLGKQIWNHDFDTTSYDTILS